MLDMKKGARKSAVDRKMAGENQPDLESQFETKDMANGMDNQPQEAPPSGSPAGGQDASGMLGELAQALEMMLPSLDPSKQGLVSQALDLLSQAAGADSGPGAEQATPTEGEDLSSMKGGRPAPIGQ
jgi:hypothetical protein